MNLRGAFPRVEKQVHDVSLVVGEGGEALRWGERMDAPGLVNDHVPPIESEGVNGGDTPLGIEKLRRRVDLEGPDREA